MRRARREPTIGSALARRRVRVVRRDTSLQARKALNLAGVAGFQITEPGDTALGGGEPEARGRVAAAPAMVRKRKRARADRAKSGVGRVRGAWPRSSSLSYGSRLIPRWRSATVIGTKSRSSNV